MAREVSADLKSAQNLSLAEARSRQGVSGYGVSGGAGVREREREPRQKKNKI